MRRSISDGAIRPLWTCPRRILLLARDRDQRSRTVVLGHSPPRASKKRDSQQEQRLPNFTGRTSERKKTSTHDINSEATKRCDPSAAFRRYAPPLAPGTTDRSDALCFSAWGEGLFLIIQTATVAALTLHYGASAQQAALFVGTFVGITSALMGGLVPVSYLWTMQVFNVPIIVIGKVASAGRIWPVGFQLVHTVSDHSTTVADSTSTTIAGTTLLIISKVVWLFSPNTIRPPAAAAPPPPPPLPPPAAPLPLSVLSLLSGTIRATISASAGRIWPVGFQLVHTVSDHSTTCCG
uniref:Uncharacterized protein n=1 Tax=Timema douglasi TaxID=61478 RepID=A0A7R8VB64_TIMDO|nr:unnamed protein product [Timema douglasi]